VEQLLKNKVQLTLNDISEQALASLKTRLGTQASQIHWLCQDISQPINSNSDRQITETIDIWIDRAVLHFLLDEKQIKGYFANLNDSLKPGGYALLAEFSKSAAPKCAGLPLHCYSVEELADRLGSTYQLITSFDYEYISPTGDIKPYIYSLFKKIT